MKHLIRLLLAGVIAYSSSALAQVNVYVDSTAPDSVGGRLSYRLKEGIRASAGMKLADTDAEALITARIVTLDPDANSAASSSRTIYSLVLTAKTMHETPVDMYLTSFVGLCGTKRVEECADGLVADTDNWVTRVVGWIREASKGAK